MSSLRAVLIAGVAIVSTPVPALACVVAMPWDPTEVKQAEVVVMGRLTNYDLVRVRHVRDLSGKAWPVGEIEFDLTVEHALVGQTPRRIRVKRGRSAFANFAEMPEGRYLVALYRPRQHDGGTFTVFQRPCSSDFLLKSGGSASVEVLRALAGVPPYVPPPPPDSLPSAAAPAMPAPNSTWHSPWPGDPPIPKVYWIAIGLVAASFAVAIGALVWRRRPRAGDAGPGADGPASD